MKKTLLMTCLMASVLSSYAEEKVITSPDGKLKVEINDNNGLLRYSVSYDGKTVLQPSHLGLKASVGDFTKDMTIADSKQYVFNRSFDMANTKKAHIDFKANAIDVNTTNAKGKKLTVTFVVGNNDVAFKYTVPRQPKDNSWGTIISEETSSFRFPDNTTTFLSPQIQPMTGWERTKPSYEEEYKADAKMTDKSQYGVGYTFPCLFHVGDMWALVSETGTDSHYPGCRLSEFDAEKGYTVAFPQEGENNGFGSATAAISINTSTPWRTITVGSSLAPIVETTIPFAVVDQKCKASTDYKPGRYVWSWLIWQDNSINYDDQVKFIDLASKYGYEYCLVDGNWDQDKFIGRKRIVELSKYAQSKGVKLMLWYNSNGFVNNAYQTPKNKMNDPVARKQEMKWLHDIGVAGIKVDFFGGDKQETMQLYEDILTDANDYGIRVIFHGCTIPRGWERMYPNYIGSEAALASENVFFTDYHAKKEGFEMTMHPFCRNAIGSFDWGGVIMNDFLSKDNKSRHQRFTSRLFEMATAITNQCSVNCVEVTPQSDNVISDIEKAYLRQIPTSWKDTKFITGYPTHYAVIARQDAKTGKWYVGGINGTGEAMKLNLSLPMFAGKTVKMYYENKQRQTLVKEVKVKKNGSFKTTLPQMGGLILESM